MHIYWLFRVHLTALQGSPTSGKGLHEMGYEAVHRHIRDLTPTASLSIRTAAGETLKSSIFHSFIHGTHDDKIAATRRKGKWAGGHPLLGYDVDPAGYKLVVNATKVERVRATFALYP